MPRPTQTLPDGYVQVFSIDLATNKTMAIVLNLAGVGVILLTFWLLAIFASWVHPELSGTAFRLGFNLTDLLLLVLLVIVNMVLHEIIHGVFFWLFTHSRPVFGLSLSYAYAAAPDWYIPMSRYWIIGLAPLLIIGITGLLVMAFGPPAYMLPAAVVIGFNTGGAVGDMWIIYKLFRLSPSCLVKDTGHSIHFYQPEKSSV
jgi:hypothetical protein